jgi:hypothetical protein
MLAKFLSLREPAKYGYAYDSDCYDGKAFFSSHFRQFQTYGDGLTQHTRDWPVQVEFLADYLASLAAMMMDDAELCNNVRFEFPQPHAKDIEFTASIIFKGLKNADGADSCYEKTVRYYSLEERKISAAPAKQYDKRYQKIEPWCDGKPDAIYRMLVPEWGNGMHHYGYADSIRDWCLNDFSKDSKRPVWDQGLPAQFLKWFDGDHRKAQELRYAHKACLAVKASWQERWQADCYLKNLRVVEDKPAESTEVA